MDIDRGVTASKRIVELIRLGMTLDHAGLSVGLSAQEIRRWMVVGLQVRSQTDAGYAWTSFSVEHREYALFAVDAQEAEGQWIATSLMQLETLARGARTTETRETLDPTGKLLLRVTKTATLIPDARVLIWRLATRFPGVYGSKSSGADLATDSADDDDVVARMRDKLLTISERLELNQGPPA